jgi:hypothetical protein
VKRSHTNRTVEYATRLIIVAAMFVAAHYRDYHVIIALLAVIGVWTVADIVRWVVQESRSG